MRTVSHVLQALKAGVAQGLLGLLNHDVSEYQLTAPNDMAGLYWELRAGDVILVEGRLRVSALVKYVTQSSWSHVAIWIGDALLRRDALTRERALAAFGDAANRLIVEALSGEGVVTSPLDKYTSHNLRICRPDGLSPAQIERVIDAVLEDVGKPYDARNFFDLGLRLVSPLRFGSLRNRDPEACVGACTEREVTCSSMLAKAFARVGYPIRPSASHHSQITPKDFDLSPHFRVIKPGESRHVPHVQLPIHQRVAERVRGIAIQAGAFRKRWRRRRPATTGATPVWKALKTAPPTAKDHGTPVRAAVDP